MLLLKENGILPLIKLIEDFKTTLGVKEVENILNKNSKMFLELLLDKGYVLVSEEKTLKNKKSRVTSWDESNYQSNYENLKLTRHQKIILLSILENEKALTLEELKEIVEEKGIKIDNGSIIGGSIAGITKKCRAYEIPEIFKNNPGDYKYSLNLAADLKTKIKTLLEEDLKEISEWNLENIERNIRQINLTDYQKKILKVSSRNSKLSFSDLKKEIKKEGLKNIKNSVLSVLISGISKKCKKTKVSSLLNVNKKTSGEAEYSLNLDDSSRNRLNEILN